MTASQRLAQRAATTAALLASLSLAAPALAQPIAITNAGFEAPVVAPGLFWLGIPPGWQPYDPSGRLNGNSDAIGVLHPLVGDTFYPAGAPEGDQAALVYLAGTGAAPAGIQQRLNHGLNVYLGTRYEVSVMVGNIASGISQPGAPDGGNVFYDLDGFPGFRVEVLAGNTVISAKEDSVLIPEGEFREVSWSFESWPYVGLRDELLTIRLINLSRPGTLQEPGIEVNFDDVRLSVVQVPEPGSWALMGLGLAGLAIGRLRKAARD